MSTATPTLWFTGLSRSGKTTIAEGVADWMRFEHDLHVQILDGSFVRDEVGNFFGYSRDERIKVSRILTVMAKLLALNGVHPIVTAITPYEESRELNRGELDPYYEVYVECSVESCMERDDEGLYRRALRGDVSNFIGVDVPFEVPKRNDVTISTEDAAPAGSIDETIQFVADMLGVQPRPA